MTWQTLIVLQILVSSVMTIFTRRLTLTSKKLFFGVAVASYITVAIAGWAYSLIAGGIPLIPPHEAWPYIIAQGVFIPAAWLVQYRLIGSIGAGNAMIITTLNMLGTALLGVLLLRETVTLQLMIGAIFVFSGVLLVLRLKPDIVHSDTMPFMSKLGLTLLGAVMFAAGMYAEKVAITMSGVWEYTAFGWSMQAIGAVALYLMFGQKEAAHVTKRFVRKGVILGLLTSMAGGLYVYALSIGTLSQTIIATSGKIVVVMLLAAFFLNERNALGVKFVAFMLTASGIWLVIN